jgi:hypothetical protein
VTGAEKRIRGSDIHRNGWERQREPGRQRAQSLNRRNSTSDSADIVQNRDDPSRELTHVGDTTAANREILDFSALSDFLVSVGDDSM